VGAGELSAHVDQAGPEVDVVPGQPEHLRDTKAGVEHGRDHQPVAWRACRQKPFDLCTPQDALAPRLRPRALVVLESLDWVGDDPPVPTGEAHDALERRQRARRGLRRAALSPQRIEQLCDVIDGDRGDPPTPQRREEVTVEVVAVRLEGARCRSPAATIASKRSSHQPTTVSKRRRGETGSSPRPTAAIKARRSRRAAARSKPTVRNRNLPAWRQQTAYLPFSCL